MRIMCIQIHGSNLTEQRKSTLLYALAGMMHVMHTVDQHHAYIEKHMHVYMFNSKGDIITHMVSNIQISL